MDYTYDGQIRRYVTQFMRIFIGFKYRTGGTVAEDRHVPVLYGDATRQVASIIKENSENKMSTVPRFACYITGLEPDRDRTADSSFVSKLNIKQRHYTGTGLTTEYSTTQGGGYTVERLMPVPYTLSMKCDLWTSNTDQKLQLLEQILVLFNPSLEIQTTDNFVDWTSLSVVNIKNLNFTSRQIPQGIESEIDICSIEFSMPIWISSPAKVKRLGVVQTIITNVFAENGDMVNLESLIYDGAKPNLTTAVNVSQLSVYLIKSPNSNTYTVSSPGVDWNIELENGGGYTDISQIFFGQPNGHNMVGTFIISPTDVSELLVTFDLDTIPANTLVPSLVNGLPSRGTIDSIIDPTKFNPLEVYGNHAAIPLGIRYLLLDNIGVNGMSEGAAGWRNLNNSDSVLVADSIIEWTGTDWVTILQPSSIVVYVQNLRTGIKYKWDLSQWVRAFEGDYATGFWGLNLYP